MMNKGIDNLRKWNVISAVVFMFTYMLAFFNVEETLVAVEGIDELYFISAWDRYTWLMIWVGVAFSIELIQHKLLRKTGKKNQIIYIILSVLQIGVMAYEIYVASGFKKHMETDYELEDFNKIATISVLCLILMIFMIVQICLALYKIYCALKEYSIWDFSYTYMDEELIIDKDSRKVIVNIIKATMIVPISWYWLQSLGIWLCNPDVLFPMAVVFSVFAIILPFCMFASKIIGGMLLEKRYNHAITATVLYALTFNGVYSHVTDRILYDGHPEFNWLNMVIQLVTIVLCALAIGFMIKMYKEPLADDERKAKIEEVNGKKSRRPLIALIIFLILGTPIGIYDKKEETYTYTNLLWNVKYINIYGDDESHDDVACHCSEKFGYEINILHFFTIATYSSYH